ncbi:MAG: hypothetical protein LBH54_05175 [Clostridiales bacterium]|jgi:hypothetical protein|nr:hypothetical protein [Clostridiales bacterium]
MKLSAKERKAESVDARVAALERALRAREDFQRLRGRQYDALRNLKQLVGADGWTVLDDYICAANEEAAYLIKYFYVCGVHEGKLRAKLLD